MHNLLYLHGLYKKIISFRVKAHYKGAQIVVTLYCFLRVPCSNFNHVIIMRDFHNVFTYYDRSNPNKLGSKETTLLIKYDVMLEYICAKKNMEDNILKNVNIFKK